MKRILSDRAFAANYLGVESPPVVPPREDTPAQVVASFPKNATQEVRAALGPYQGQRVVSLWVFVQTRLGMVPTKHGLSLGVASLPELKRAVDALCDAAGVTVTES